MLSFECQIFPNETYNHIYSAKKKSPDYNRRYSDQTVNVLFAGNCTGEYFGSGPVCRCQEAMRYFVSQLSHHFDWFIFLDDDVFIRPFSFFYLLQSILPQNEYTPLFDRLNELINQPLSLSRSIKNNTLLQLGQKPLALLSSSRYRGFESSTAWKGTDPNSYEVNTSNCSVSGVHDFAFAQPVILNRCFRLNAYLG